MNGSDVPITRIEPSRGWVSLKLHDLWEYRELLYFLAWRDIKVRYKQTFLGAAWGDHLTSNNDGCIGVDNSGALDQRCLLLPAHGKNVCRHRLAGSREQGAERNE